MVNDTNLGIVEIGYADKTGIIVILSEIVSDTAHHEHHALVGVCLVIAHRIGSIA